MVDGTLGRRISGRLRAPARAALSRLPSGALVSLERLVQEAQGKGSGTASVRAEVEAAVGFLPPERRRDPLVLDIGANVGDWTAALLAAVPGADVHCFEPGSAARQRLVERFHGDERVTIISTAVGRSSGTATLWSDVPGSGLASLTRRDLGHRSRTFDHSETVSVTTLDAWTRSRGRAPDLVKLDVEGHELEVLIGGPETLLATSVIQFEFGGCNIDTHTFLRDFWRLLTEAGFRLTRVGPRGAVELDPYSEADETFRVTNFVAHRAGS